MQIAMKDILMQLIPLGTPGWSKMVFHFYIPSENEFDCSLYFQTESGEYIDALTLVEKGSLAKTDMDNAFWTVIGLLRNKYIESPENQRWSGLTLVCSSDFHASLYFEYSDTNYGLTKEWAYKYLKSNKQEENTMNRIDYLPLGSVVLLHGGIQKILIIARGINTKQGDKTVFFDYGAVLYPDGLTGDRMAYFNHDAVSKVVFYGYDDEDSKICADNINDYLAANPNVQRGTPAV